MNQQNHAIFLMMSTNGRSFWDDIFPQICVNSIDMVCCKHRKSIVNNMYLLNMLNKIHKRHVQRKNKIPQQMLRYRFD